MNTQKPIASLSLDVDNRWSYMKTHGDSGWESFPSYLDTLTPRVLEFLAQRNLTITFFVVGQDAVLEKNYAALKAIASAGHELGNHSFSHEPWLHLYARETIEEEIKTTEDCLTNIAGTRPLGFRGPGFSISEVALEILVQRNYLYDASTLPSFIGPLARAYYFLTSNLDAKQLKERSALFGSVRDGLRPLKPYRWKGKDGLLEIPVTTMPILRCPIHMSYVLYLEAVSPLLALSYFRSALILCRLAGVSPSLLLHSLDFLGLDDKVGLEFFPAMRLSSDRKLRLVSKVLKMFCDEFHVVNLSQHALHVAEESRAVVAANYSNVSLP
jgi:peptidoglycan-N-acetylglucosamine deacetylase